MATLNLGKVKGDTGPQGQRGPQGETGMRGPSYQPDAISTSSTLGLFADQNVGFSVLGTDTGMIYFRVGDSGNWSDGIPFGRGDKGDTGPQGPAGADGIVTDAPFDGASYIRKNGSWIVFSNSTDGGGGGGDGGDGGDGDTGNVTAPFVRTTAYGSANAVLANSTSAFLPDYWMALNPDLVRVDLMSTLQSIGEYSFEGAGFGSLTLPDSLTTIFDYAFTKSRLGSLSIPDQTTQIGQYAFEFCSELASVTIGRGCTSIGVGAFKDCSSLVTINCLAELPPDIDDDAFLGVPATLIHVPIGAEWYGSMYGGLPVSYDIDTKNTVSTANSVDGGSLATSASVYLPDNWLLNVSSATKVNLKSTLLRIGVSAFQGTTFNKIALPESLKIIANYAFKGQSGLYSLTIPDSVTEIGIGAFESTNLRNVIIGSGCTVISRDAFKGSTSLGTVYCRAMAAPTLELSYQFSGVEATEIHVPIGATGYGDTYGGLKVVYDVDVAITGNRRLITPIITREPSASLLIAGDRLSDSTLSGGVASHNGVAVAGTFSFAVPKKVITAFGTSQQGYVFTPTDTAKFNIAIGSGDITASFNYRNTPLTTTPTTSVITYGQTLASAGPNGGYAQHNGVQVFGTFAFTDPRIVPSVGTAAYAWEFTPMNRTSFNRATGTANVVVNKITPTVTTPPKVTARADSGKPLWSLPLVDGVASVAGTFAFRYQSGLISLGERSEMWWFTPTDTEIYNTVEGYIMVKGNSVGKTSPVIITRPTSSSILEGQTLADCVLSGGEASVEGTFSMTDPTTKPPVGFADRRVTFTPTDSALYDIEYSSTQVTVLADAKRIVTITTAPTATPITVGFAVGESTLSGAASVAGVFSFTDPTRVPHSDTIYTGTAYTGWKFTPENTADYNPVTGTLALTVNPKGTPTFTTAPTATPLEVGEYLKTSVLSGVASVEGTFSFNEPFRAFPLGPNEVYFTFTPTDGRRYNSVVGQVTVTGVPYVKKTPVITTPPTANWTYGTSAEFSGGVASVAGVGVISGRFRGTVNPDYVKRELTTTYWFTPTDTKKYNESEQATLLAEPVRRSLYIWKPPIASNNISSGATLDSVTLKVSLSVYGSYGWVTTESYVAPYARPDWVPGVFTFTSPKTIPPMGTSEQEITFTPNDPFSYLPLKGKVTVYTVSVDGKQHATITTAPTASSIVEGQTLASSTLSGVASVAGTFTFMSPNALPTVGVTSQGWTFTPSDTTTYRSLTGTVSVTTTASVTSRITPTITTAPTASSITEGQTLASSTLSGGVASVAGAFTFTSPNAIPTVGTVLQGWTFTPTDNVAHNAVTGTVSVVVVAIVKMTPTITTAPTASSIWAGQILASSTLSGGFASVAGTFEFTNSLSDRPSEGVGPQPWLFTPSNTTLYNTVTGVVSLSVRPFAGAIAYDSSNRVVAEATGNVPNNWLYGNISTTKVIIGSQCTSIGTAAFRNCTQLSSITSYAMVAPTLGAGAFDNITATYITVPTGAAGYREAGAVGYSDTWGGRSVVTQIFAKRALAVSTAPTASSITAGQSLASAALSGGFVDYLGAPVLGVLSFTSPNNIPLAGISSQGWTFTPSETTIYNTLAGSVNVTATILKTTPTITTAPIASPILTGQNLTSSTLSGGVASVAGTFAFTDRFTIPLAGLSLQGWTFTPSNTTLYNTVTGTVIVTANGKTTPAVTTAPTASSITEGQTLASSTLSGGVASVAGTFAFTSLNAVPTVGTTSQGWTFTPSNTTLYNAVTGTVNVTITVPVVNRITPTITTAPTASSILFSQSLASSTLSGGVASVAGTFAFTSPSVVPTIGIALQGWTFTPTNPAEYNAVTGFVSVSVAAVVKTSPTITTPPTASPLVFGEPISYSTLSGGVASVEGTFAFTYPNAMAFAGTPSHSWTFTPTNTMFYNTVTGTVKVTVTKATPIITNQPTASSLLEYDALAYSTLSGGVASSATLDGGDMTPLAGTFEFTDPRIEPPVGVSTQSWTFTPTASAGYNTVTGTVSVMVNGRMGATLVTGPIATVTNYGKTYISASLSGGEVAAIGGYPLLNGRFILDGGSSFYTVGTSLKPYTFYPNNTAYQRVKGTVSVTVPQCIPIMAAPYIIIDGERPRPLIATAIVYGQSLASSTLSGGVMVEEATDPNRLVQGTFRFTNPSIVPPVGNQDLQMVTFTPSDPFYATVTNLKVVVVVSPSGS